MAEIRNYDLYTRKNKSGKDIYYYRLYYEGEEGRSPGRSTGKTSEKAARAFVTKLIAEKNKAVRYSPKLKDFATDFFDWETSEWIKRRHTYGLPFSKPMAGVRSGHLKNHILPEFGSKRLNQIYGDTVEDWVISLSLANGTKNQILYTFSIVLQEAVRKRLLDKNPLRKEEVQRFGDDSKTRDAFTLEELKALFPKDKHRLMHIWKEQRWYTLFYLMLVTGLRVGEAAALMWKHIIWEIPGVEIVQAVKASNTVGPTKNRGVRGALLPKRAVIMLKTWHEETIFDEPQHYIFFGRSGDLHIHPKTISKKFPPALERAEIETEGRYLGAHSLRHTYNTRLENLLPGKTLRYMIGHSNEKMTSHYLHKTPGEWLQENVQSAKLIEEAWRL